MLTFILLFTFYSELHLYTICMTIKRNNISYDGNIFYKNENQHDREDRSATVYA